MKIDSEERLTPTAYALVKEYLKAEATYRGISRVTGLPIAQIMEVDNTNYYKEYQHIQDEKVTQGILDDAFEQYEE